MHLFLDNMGILFGNNKQGSWISSTVQAFWNCFVPPTKGNRYMLTRARAFLCPDADVARLI